MAIGLATGTSLGGLAGGAATARLLVWIGGDATSLSRALSQASGGVSSFASGATRIGGSLIRNVSLPIAAVSAGAIKMSMDFEAAMARVAGLTPVVEESGKSIEHWGDQILELAKTVPTAPVELANAFYFAASAGLEASRAFEITELSAKGAAIGMGDAAAIAKVLIFATNAYGPAALGAEEAMDALTAAIREGTAEPEDMAIALGRLLPIAAEAGITFQSVVGSLAALTNIGLPARVAVTSLRALFTELLSPTIKAKKALDSLGISGQELADAMNAGPLVALELLHDATEGNFDMLHEIVPQIRGFTALLGLSGDQMRRVSKIFDETANSAGDFDRAFDHFTETTAFKFGIGLNNLRIAAIELGAVMFPIFERIIGVLGDFGKVIADMPGWGKTTLVSFLAVAAAAGPLIKLFGALTANGAGLFSTFGAGVVGIGTLAVSVGLLTGSFTSLAKGTGGVVSAITALVTSFAIAKISLGGLMAIAAKFAPQIVNIGGIMTIQGSRMAGAFASMGAAASTAAAVGIAALVVTIGYVISEMGRGARETTALSQAIVDLGYAGQLTSTQLSTLAEGSRVGDVFRDIARDAGVAGKSISEALGPSLVEINDQLLEMAQTAQQDAFNPDAFDPFIKVLESIRGTGADASEAFTAAGLRMQDFAATFSNAADIIDGRSPKTFQDLVMNLSRVQEALQFAETDLPRATAERIAAFGREGQAVESLAQRYGTSVPFMEGLLSKYGESADGLVQSGVDVMDSFATQSGIMDETTESIIGNIAEMKAAFSGDFGARVDDLLGSFNLFGEIPEQIESSTSSLISNLQKNKDYLAGYASDVQALLARGLDPEVLGALVQEGPAMVRQFADASAGELKTLEEAYKTSMDLIDAAVLAEGAHQVVKGHDMVAGFGQAIMEMQRVPVNAATQLMSAVSLAFTAGDLSPAGLAMVESIAGGINLNSEIPVEAVGVIISRLAQQVHLFDGRALGQEAIAKLAIGLTQGTEASAAAVSVVLQRIIGQVKTVGPAMAAQGKIDSMMYAEGYRGGVAPAAAAGHAVGNAAVQGISVNGAVMLVLGLQQGQGYALSVGSAAGAAQGAGVAVGGASVGGMASGGAGASAVGLSAGASFASSVASQTGSAYSAGYALGAAMSAGVEAGSKGSPQYYTYYLGQRIADAYGEGLSKGAKRLNFNPQLKRVPLNQLGSKLSSNPAAAARPPVNENHYHFHAADQLTIDRIAAAVSERQAQRVAF